MAGKATALRSSELTSFWQSLRRGPWPERVIQRLQQALDKIGADLRARGEVAGVILFGSYARGEYGIKSDVDLLILFEGRQQPGTTPTGVAVLRVVGEAEAEARLPMHIAPLLASVDRPEDLGPELLHDIWADGVVLYAKAGALARLLPPGLSAFSVIRFQTAGMPAKDRVRLSRRLHGMKGRGGVLGPRALTLGRGVLLVPAAQQAAIRALLDEAGAVYDIIPVWREI